MTDTPTTPRVYSAIAAVMAALATEGISKERRNQQQGYNFRGIDDVYNALSPILSRHNLCMLPRILSREVVERQTAGSDRSPPKPLFYVTVEAEFDLVCAEDGSKHTIRTYGEAMDMADKATNKAMSAAYKYAAMQAFAIPTEGDNDADATTLEVAATPAASKAKSRDVYSEMQAEIDACLTLQDLGILWTSKAFQTEFKALPRDWQDQLTERKDARKEALSEPAPRAYVAPNFEGIPA